MAANNSFTVVGFCASEPKVVSMDTYSYRLITLETDGFEKKDKKFSIYNVPIRLDMYTRGANKHLSGNMLAISGLIMSYKRSNYDNIFLKAEDVRIIGRDSKETSAFVDRKEPEKTEPIEVNIDDVELPF